MAASLPYLASNKNVSILFDKIKAAKAPDKFTHNFLTTVIGLKGTNDRQLIPLLRNMGFIDQSGTPTSSYSLLKGHNAASAIAEGMRHAYASIFDAHQDAQNLPLDRLKGLISQVGGVDADATSRIASTFNSIAKLANFDLAGPSPSVSEKPTTATAPTSADPERQTSRPSGLRTEFHYNIQIHLPANGNEETYLNIFSAIRKTFQ
ncbi:DUF5343 domain-containing protein [Nitrospirillum amazonense]|uniref:DUF5343 domain-containing protein n=1 Tax=Nitrospirillum amazonense TaxID=28077 RepID=UPI002DD42424|nr:DUF5343 domain-containing protein [Nitrospirillum amazonense]MEC4594441.1 DUF5343 domain-containing protein [Nitrospirillum amazonense]